MNVGHQEPQQVEAIVRTGCWQGSSQPHPCWVPASCSDSNPDGFVSTYHTFQRKRAHFCLIALGKSFKTMTMTTIFISLDKGEPISEGKRMKCSHWLSLGHVIQHQHPRGSQAQRDPTMENGLLRKREIRTIETEDTQYTHLVCFANCHTHSCWKHSSVCGARGFSSYMELTPPGTEAYCFLRHSHPLQRSPLTLAEPEIITQCHHVPACALSDFEPLSESHPLHPLRMLFA